MSDIEDVDKDKGMRQLLKLRKKTLLSKKKIKQKADRRRGRKRGRRR